MDKYIKLVTENPYVLRIILVVVGVIIILAVKKLIRSRLSKYVKDDNNFYRSKKAINAAGYLFILLLISIIYRESLGALNVFFGIDAYDQQKNESG